MSEYVTLNQADDYIHVWFYNENDKPFEIGDKMNGLNEDAYMNGYNWNAVFNYYLAKHAPDVLMGMDSSPEAGSYAAIYENSPENLIRAQKFITIIKELIENEDVLYQIVQEDADAIEWD